MSTPTPRTDAAWSATFDGEQMSAGQTARALREHSQQLKTELTTLTTERDQLRFENSNLRAGQKACEACDEPTAFEMQQLRGALTAERDQLRADRTYNHECINRLATATRTLGEKSEKVVGVAISTIDHLRAENERLRRAYVRPDDIRTQLESVTARAERAEAELATERARLDWVFRNCKVFAADYTIHDREDLGAAMKEGAK